MLVNQATPAHMCLPVHLHPVCKAALCLIADSVSSSMLTLSVSLFSVGIWIEKVCRAAQLQASLSSLLRLGKVGLGRACDQAHTIRLASMMPCCGHDHYCRLPCTCSGNETLSLAVVQRAQPPRSTTHQVLTFAWASAVYTAIQGCSVSFGPALGIKIIPAYKDTGCKGCWVIPAYMLETSAHVPIHLFASLHQHLDSTLV